MICKALVVSRQSYCRPFLVREGTRSCASAAGKMAALPGGGPGFVRAAAGKLPALPGNQILCGIFLAVRLHRIIIHRNNRATGHPIIGIAAGTAPDPPGAVAPSTIYTFYTADYPRSVSGGIGIIGVSTRSSTALK